jgi:homoserine acetyltransferase
MSRDKVLQSLEEKARQPGPDANDHIRQMEAMMALDVSDSFAGSMEKAAVAVRAKVLVVVGAYDHVVTPEPAKNFAKLLGAELLEIPSDCGHQTPSCEAEKVGAAVSRFLAE